MVNTYIVQSGGCRFESLWGFGFLKKALIMKLTIVEKNLLSWTAMHIDFVMCKKEKNLICNENWNCLDRKNATSSRKCKALRVAATKAMQTAEFKNYCRETLGIAPNYFIAQECAKVTGSISEAAVSTQILSK